MRRSRGALAAAVAVIVAYEGWGKRWQMRWGATEEEATSRLLGDERTPEPATQVTRAITIAAAPEAVWPWLVQLGADRAGFYSYDRLEDLFGLGIHSANELVPAWQRLAVGDIVWASRARSGGWIVGALVPNEVLVLEVADIRHHRPARRDEGTGFEFRWTFALRRRPDGTTRLLVRERVAFGRPATRWLMAPAGLASFVMTRKMLLGIRDRAEGSARPRDPQLPGGR